MTGDSKKRSLWQNKVADCAKFLKIRIAILFKSCYTTLWQSRALICTSACRGLSFFCHLCFGGFTPWFPFRYAKTGKAASAIFTLHFPQTPPIIKVRNACRFLFCLRHYCCFFGSFSTGRRKMKRNTHFKCTGRES